MADQDVKVRENRLRRAAERQGLRLEKSRRRDPRAYDYGTYYLVQGPPPERGGTNWKARTLVSPEQGLTLDEVEAYLTRDPSSDRQTGQADSPTSNGEGTR